MDLKTCAINKSFLFACMSIAASTSQEMLEIVYFLHIKVSTSFVLCVGILLCKSSVHHFTVVTSVHRFECTCSLYLLYKY